MSSSIDRGWMYRMTDSDGFLCLDYCHNVDIFLNYAYSNETIVERKIARDGETVLQIKCPCSKCKNTKYTEREIVKHHLISKGFMAGYTTWDQHGETRNGEIGECSNTMEDDDDAYGCTRMVLDSMYPTSFNQTFQSNIDSNIWEEQMPNPSAKGFYDMLKDADEPLYNGCQNWTKLGAATRLLNWKADCNVPEATFNYIVKDLRNMLPPGNHFCDNFYETKKTLKPLSLPKQKIHACKNHCMLFYKEDLEVTNCRWCGESRYKSGGRKVPNLVLTYLPIAPRLQRLYMSEKTAKQMTWHFDHQTESGSMVHPSDGKAWKHFDENHSFFAEEVRNVRLGLCTDGFSPNNSNSNPYSLWPVFLTIYNLPPWMSLKDAYVKLSLVIPGKKSPGQNLDVFLRPLIDELKELWDDGVDTYDAYRKENFTMRAILLWTVSDFPAYAMLSGWSTHGRLACPYCMGNTDSFRLRTGGKPCWFDCHRRFLPTTHSYRRDRRGFRARHTVLSSRTPSTSNSL